MPGASTRFLSTCVFCLSIAVLAVIIPDLQQRLMLFRDYGFLCVFLTVVLWASSWPIPHVSRYRLGVLIRGNLLPMLLALLLIATAFLVSPPQFRVLADETNLAGISMNMFLRRQITNPIETVPFAVTMQDTITEVVDKRPLLFPLLTFFVHSFLGYHPENAFLLNAVISFLLLLQFYLLLNRWFSRFWSGVGMTLLAAYPLLVLSMTSGSFEMLNLLLIMTCFRSLERLVRLRNVRRAEFLLWTLVLSAQCRYESAVYLPLMFPVAVWVLYKSSLDEIPLRAGVLPLAIVPIFWQRLSFLADSLFDLPAGKSAFSTEWLWPNLVAATSFFFGQKSSYGMIPLLTVGAIAGLIFTALILLRRRTAATESTIVVASIVALSTIFQSAILYLYYWGNLTNRYSFRLGIVFVPVIITLNLLWLTRIQLQQWRCYFTVCLLCLSCLVYYRPVAGMNAASQGMLIYREFQQVRHFLSAQYPQKDVLLISHRPALFTPFRFGAVSIQTAIDKAHLLRERWQNGSFREIVIHQCIRRQDGKGVEPDTGIELPVSTLLTSLASPSAGFHPQSETLLTSELSEEFQMRLIRVFSP